MDPFEYLPVRFHFNGEFIRTGRQVQYIGARMEVSFIDRDKVSLPEIIGHLKDHCNVSERALLHWLLPGKELNNGLRLLLDDKGCLEVAGTIGDGEVAEIYVEEPIALEESECDEGSEYEEEEGTSDEDDSLNEQEVQEELDDEGPEIEEDTQPVHAANEFLGAAIVPSGNRAGIQQPIQLDEGWKNSRKDKGKQVVVHDPKSGDSSDSDYLPGDECSSEDDDEVVEILTKFRVFKRRLKAGQVANLDEVILDSPKEVPNLYEIEDEGNLTPYDGSSDDEDSVEEMSDGDIQKCTSKCPRFNKKEPIPKFEIGMKFSGKKQFKKACIKHGLVERKLIKFYKNEASRMIAVCDWSTCKWRCMASVNSRSSSWQIASYNAEHTCPPRRDNRLVTAGRIAAKYEKMIIANPAWGLDSMKTTVQEDMFVDVSFSKLKRAKSMVMQKALDATKGQYLLLYNYQLELLRSNPGSTVIVRRQGDTDIFQRMYICLDALKKGFKAGCRKVVGLDGCFFKGATNGELLCAIGRDANNQIYPIAWAVVEKENNDSWDWFCDLLFRDIEVYGGTGWVFISDQQKGILNAVQKWAPDAEHRNCARHIYANWRKKFKKKEW